MDKNTRIRSELRSSISHLESLKVHHNALGCRKMTGKKAIKNDDRRRDLKRSIARNEKRVRSLMYKAEGLMTFEEMEGFENDIGGVKI